MATKRKPALKATQPQQTCGLPKIGEAFEGCTYIALLTEIGTGRPYLLLHMSTLGVHKTWQEAMDLQTDDVSIPNAVEGAVLHESGTVKVSFWLGKPYGANNAWVQDAGGGQYVYGRGSKFAAVRVRRLFLDSFDPLAGAKRRAAEDVAKLKESAAALVAACEAAEEVAA